MEATNTKKEGPPKRPRANRLPRELLETKTHTPCARASRHCAHVPRSYNYPVRMGMYHVHGAYLARAHDPPRIQSWSSCFALQLVPHIQRPIYSVPKTFGRVIKVYEII